MGSPLESLHPVPSPRVEGEGIQLPSIRESGFLYLKRLGLPVLAFAAVGCASPVGSLVEKTSAAPTTHHEVTPIVPASASMSPEQAKALGSAINDALKKIQYPDVDWGFTESEEGEIRSSQLAKAARSLEGEFTKKEIDAFLEQLPLLFTKIESDKGIEIIPRFNVRLVRALSTQSPRIHLKLPSQDQMQEYGITEKHLTRPIFEDVAREWNVRYGKVPIPSSESSGSIVCEYIPVSSISEYNEKTAISMQAAGKIHSPLIGDYQSIFENTVRMPAISPENLYQEFSVPKNVLEQQHALEQGKNFQYLFLQQVTGERPNKDKFDILYGAVQTFALPFSEKLVGRPDVSHVKGDDGVDYAIVPRNTQIALDKSNVLMRVLMALVSKDNFEEPVSPVSLEK